MNDKKLYTHGDAQKDSGQDFKKSSSSFSRWVDENRKAFAGKGIVVNGSKTDFAYSSTSLFDKGHRQSVYERRKNCYNCRFMEWGDGDVGDPEGWICTRKDFSNPREESDMIEKMDTPAYRFKSKVCYRDKK